jgi:hypothetical protein
MVVLVIFVSLIFLAIAVGIAVLFFRAAYRMAEVRGRNSVLWGIAAIFFFSLPFIALLLWMFGETDEHREHRIYREEKIREEARINVSLKIRQEELNRELENFKREGNSYQGSDSDYNSKYRPKHPNEDQ